MGATSGVEIISASNLVVLLKRARISSIFNILIAGPRALISLPLLL